MEESSLYFKNLAQEKLQFLIKKHCVYPFLSKNTSIFSVLFDTEILYFLYASILSNKQYTVVEKQKSFLHTEYNGCDEKEYQWRIQNTPIPSMVQMLLHSLQHHVLSNTFRFSAMKNANLHENDIWFHEKNTDGFQFVFEKKRTQQQDESISRFSRKETSRVWRMTDLLVLYFLALLLKCLFSQKHEFSHYYADRLMALDAIKKNTRGVYWAFTLPLYTHCYELHTDRLFAILTSKIHHPFVLQCIHEYIHLSRCAHESVQTVFDKECARVYYLHFDKKIQTCMQNIQNVFRDAVYYQCFPRYKTSFFDAFMKKQLCNDALQNHHYREMKSLIFFKKVYVFRTNTQCFVAIRGSFTDCLQICTLCVRYFQQFLTLKTHDCSIVHTMKQSIMYLDVDITYTHYSYPTFRVPRSHLFNLLSLHGFLKKTHTRYKPTAYGQWIHNDVHTIIRKYTHLCYYIKNTYISKQHTFECAPIFRLLRYSCAVTLGRKLRLHSMAKVFHRFAKQLHPKYFFMK